MDAEGLSQVTRWPPLCLLVLLPDDVRLGLGNPGVVRDVLTVVAGDPEEGPRLRLVAGQVPLLNVVHVRVDETDALFFEEVAQVNDLITKEVALFHR